RPGRLALALLLLAGASGLAFFPAFVLAREFDRLERDAIRQDTTRIQEAVQNELRSLAIVAKDWGVWDESYAFIHDRNPGFIKANLGWESLLSSTQIQLIYLLDPQGAIVWGDAKLAAGPGVPPPEFAQARIRELPVLAALDEPGTGLLMTSAGPLLLAAQPIRRSDGSGPTAGTIIMGRLLDTERLQGLSRLLGLPLQARDTLRQPLPPGEAQEWMGRDWKPGLRVRGRSSLDLLVAIPDLRGKEHLILVGSWPRTIHMQGLRTGSFVFFTVFAASLAVAGVLLAAFLQHLRTIRLHHGALEDTVARRTAELQEAEHRFRAFVDHTRDLMFWFRLDEAQDAYVMEGVNPAGLRFMGRTLEQVAGLAAGVCLPPSVAGALERHVRDSATRGTPLAMEDGLELDGQRRVFHVEFVPVPDEDGKVRLIVGSARDITALRQREEALLHTQKLESLGVLAGGIAHDFNNLLTAAGGNLDIVELLMREDPECRQYFEQVRSALAKAANLTRQMLAYSGRGRFVLQVHDLNAVVKEITALLEVSIGKKAQLLCDLAPGLPLMEADAAQIQQVIMNLVTNAADALQGGPGTIQVRTRTEALDGEAIARLPVHYMAPGPHVVLEVSDTGSGMSPDVQERIFEPFFSTKGAGRGLGLSAMLGILRSHHGGLALSSTPGQGTCFTLWFPASSQRRPDLQTGAPASGEEVVKDGMILLVEDDTGIRNATARLLRSLGFPVVEAQDGIDGLACFAEHGQDICLVLLDLTMPRMDGREFLAEIRKSAPDLPVVITSGYTEQELPAGDPALRFLQKPYPLSELKAAVFKALHRSA
ncbi:MAG TPA: CHASE4 domain-containing protein, partial [Holophaga sp.]|nr:CHASE4 domain-containing protein [Holophaga sp.]